MCFCSRSSITYVEEFSFRELVCFNKQQLYWNWSPLQCFFIYSIFFNDVGQKLRNNYSKHTSDGVLYYSSYIFFSLVPIFQYGVGNIQHEVFCGIDCFLLCFCSMFLITYVEEFSFWELVCFVKQQLYWNEVLCNVFYFLFFSMTWDKNSGTLIQKTPLMECFNAINLLV